MIYTKSDSGLHAIKDRHAVDISRSQRSALILFDGRRSVRDVLEATATLGVTASDVEALVSLGLLRQAGAASAPEGARSGAAATPLRAAAPQADTRQAALNDDERIRRYRMAYPMATQVTARLGLKGFKLNLAVEAAQGFDGLVELLPRLHAVLGDEGVRPLREVLEGH